VRAVALDRATGEVPGHGQPITALEAHDFAVRNLRPDDWKISTKIRKAFTQSRDSGALRRLGFQNHNRHRLFGGTRTLRIFHDVLPGLRAGRKKLFIAAVQCWVYGKVSHGVWLA